MITYVVYLIVIFVMISPSTSPVHAEELEQPKEPAAAIVNGERIPMSALDREIQAAMSRNPELRSEGVAALREMRKEVLNYLIDQELMVQEGKKAGFEARDIEIDTKIAQIKQRFPSEEMFEQVLKQQKLTEEKLRGMIERGLIMDKVLDIKIKPLAKPVKDEDIAKFYEENKERFVEYEKVRARHILIKVATDANDQERNDAKSKIQNILEKARGGSDFPELAKEHSQCPTASQGGDLSYFTRGQMVKPFEDAAFSLEPGQISDVVETQFGYHIILVLDRKPETQLKLEDVSEEIEKVLYEKEMDAALENWLKPVREKANINILLKG